MRLEADDGTRVSTAAPLGNSTGSVPYGLYPFQPSDPNAVLDSITVRTEGPWSVTIAPISSAKELPAAGTSGIGARAFISTGPPTEWVLTHRPHPRLSGTVFKRCNGGLTKRKHLPDTVSGPDPYARSQTLLLSRGPSVVVIYAWTKWTISPK